MRSIKKHKEGKLRLRFRLLVDEKDEIIGFVIKGCGNVRSKIFCITFSQAMKKRNASIKLKCGWFLIPARIILKNCLHKPPEKCSFKLKKEEMKRLEEILKSNQSITKEFSSKDGGNFELYVK